MLPLMFLYNYYNIVNITVCRTVNLNSKKYSICATLNNASLMLHISPCMQKKIRKIEIEIFE